MANVKHSTTVDEEIIETEKSVTGSGKNADSTSLLELGSDKNKKIIVGVVAVLLVAVAGFFLYRYFNSGIDMEAEEQMTQAFKFYEKDSFDKAIKGTAMSPGLEKMIDEYGGSHAGNMSKYMLGTVLLNQGKIDAAIEQLEAFSKEENMVSAAAYSALAYAYEEKKDFNKAASFYNKASEVKENSATSSEFMAQAARCYMEAGNKEEAISTYKKLHKLYPNTDAGRNAEKYVALLSE